MRGQLDKLIAAAEGQSAVIQVLPFSCADAPGAGGPLALFERAGHPPVAYAEGWESGRVIEQPEEVATVVTTLNVIKSSALVRDTKDNGTGPVLAFTLGAWERFTDGLK